MDIRMRRAKNISNNRPPLQPIKRDGTLHSSLDTFARHGHNALFILGLQHTEALRVGRRLAAFVLQYVVQEGPVDDVLGAVVFAAEAGGVDVLCWVVVVVPGEGGG